MAIGAGGLIAGCAPGAPGASTTASAGAAATATAAAATRWGMTAAQDAAWREVETAAKREGKLVYYSLGSIPPAQVDRLRSEFAKDHTDIAIEYLAVGNGAAMTTRVTTEQQARIYVASAMDHSVRAVRLLEAHLEPFVPPAVKDPSVKWLYDPIADPGGRGTINATFAQFFAIWTNTNLVKSADAPKNLMQVASDPKWKGQIIMRTPWTSGGGNHNFHFANQVYGMDWVTKMQAQNITFADDQDAALLQVARGEFAIGIGLTGRQGATFIKQGQPIAAVWPDDFAVTITQGTHILKGAPAPNAAKVFVNWMMTKRGQELWRDLGQFPIRTDVLPNEPWMQGVANVKKTYENLMLEKEQQASFDLAAKYFKK